jgi:hypothetical protein
LADARLTSRLPSPSAAQIRLLFTGLTRSRIQTLFCLRQHGTSQLLFVFSLAERKNEQQKQIKVPL